MIRYATHDEEVDYQWGHQVSAFDWAKQAANTQDPVDPDEDKEAPPQEKVYGWCREFSSSAKVLRRRRPKLCSAFVLLLKSDESLHQEII